MRRVYDPGRTDPLAAAAGAATATAAAGRGLAEAGHARRAVRGEDRELLLDVGRAAVGARGGLVTADELLEVRLAAHADVLVDRHARTVASLDASSERRRHPLRHAAARGRVAARARRGRRRR